MCVVGAGGDRGGAGKAGGGEERWIGGGDDRHVVGGGCGWCSAPPVACASGVVVAAKEFAAKRAVRAVIVRVYRDQTPRRCDASRSTCRRDALRARAPFNRRCVRAASEVTA